MHNNYLLLSVIPFINGSCATWNFPAAPEQTISAILEEFTYNKYWSIYDFVITDDPLHGQLIYMIDGDNQRIVRYSIDCQSLLRWDVPKINATALFFRYNSLYIFDSTNYRVEKWLIRNSTIESRRVIAGGNGYGSNINQIANCRGGGLYVDSHENVYVGDWDNHRVTRWNNKTGDVQLIAGGHGNGSQYFQLSNPVGIYVDTERSSESDGSVYIADWGNNRVMRWRVNQTVGDLIATSIILNRDEMTQLFFPTAIISDRNGYLYISSFRFVSKYLINSNQTNSTDSLFDLMDTNINTYGIDNLRFDNEGNLYINTWSDIRYPINRLNINKTKCCK